MTAEELDTLLRQAGIALPRQSLARPCPAPKRCWRWRINCQKPMPPMRDLLDQPLRQQATAIAEGRAQISQIMDATLARIHARDPALRAVVHLSGNPTPQSGPLQGLPIGIKDLLDVDGQPTRCGSHAHDAPGPEAAAITRLRAAGLTPLAKLATYEYALTGPAWDQPNQPARNPWNIAHITGGSSSGSAAAVAGGLFRAALGTDTGGSIRAPAAYCGITGLKPTHGTVPDKGCFPLSPSLDVIGPLAATVEDAATVLDALAPGTDACAQLSQPIAGQSIGYARDWFAHDPACHPDVLRAMDDTAASLSQLGARVSLVTLPDYPTLEAAGCVILQAEAWDIHKSRLAHNWQSYGKDARRNLMTGAVLTDTHVARARAIALSFRAKVDELLLSHAALLTPTTLSPAPKFSDFEDGPVWTAMRTLPFNMSGHPAISVPCGLAANGLPLGAQLVAKHHQDALLCQIAHAFEQATPPLGPPPSLPKAQERAEV
ncbi:amidase [Tropicibacter naphthalenivorans]|uniref:Glutamyl-tRNA(Gln) amidotransferase subunit A n=1 Tax=Tropicibacter naphthalenivorans TaxID=441103 RepID=A0A0P1GK34_9RHOB|nr:amidase [Tropicibacter naphthalenivorans]CUH81980.1 Glutamyl-tRNA(Gln) amidotransferase subunit A [Tropicibacter naphthalenivorans]SMD07830.1 aspartyl-tRNA(Asn)/glutamyl-tRNA(Gln) amidotransferase subunit A [Tropicibacter naphthalenivorans]